MRVEVNTELCQGHNRCYALAPELCGLACELPGVAFIGISRDHSRATLFVMRRNRIHDLGPRDLVSAVLASAAPEPSPRTAPA